MTEKLFQDFSEPVQTTLSVGKKGKRNQNSQGRLLNKKKMVLYLHYNALAKPKKTSRQEIRDANYQNRKNKFLAKTYYVPTSVNYAENNRKKEARNIT